MTPIRKHRLNLRTHRMSQLTLALQDAQLPKYIALDVLPTNQTSWKHPIHRWYNFIAGYSPEFVIRCIGESKLNRGRVVLDPFAGCGTTLVAAALSGFKAIGYEPHPFFFKIALAKAQPALAPAKIKAIGEILSKGFKASCANNAVSTDAWKFLSKLFDQPVLHALLGARSCLEKSEFADDPIAFLIVSRLIDECSFAQTDGIYKAPTSRKRASSPPEALSEIIRDISCDIGAPQYAIKPMMHNSSAEHMYDVADESVDLIVTSPPYLNNFDFAEMTRMHLYFWGMAASWADITNKVRSILVVNTTTALKGHREKQLAYESLIPDSIHNELRQLAAALALIKRTKAGKKDYDLLLRPYMAQLCVIYRECFRVLRPGAFAHTMIGDAAFYGIHVPSPQWLVVALKSIGFSEVRCELVRKRGHRWILSKRSGSPTGLGEYHIIARK